MKKLLLAEVIKQIPLSFLYFVLGCALGYVSSVILFYLNKNFLEYLIQIWLKRITFGLGYFGENYGIWFILNNFIAVLMIIASIMLMMTLIFRRRKFYFSRKFEGFERHHTKVGLYSLYIIPIGALLINGFLLSLLLTFLLLNNGFSVFLLNLLLVLPHGITELTALILSTSLALVYLKILRPSIIRGEWETSKKIGKNLLLSHTTFLIIFFLAILILFSGFIEGSFVSLIKQNLLKQAM